jgi:hypothetical protein
MPRLNRSAWPPPPFESLELRNVVYEYKFTDADDFTLGPVTDRVAMLCDGGTYSPARGVAA